MPDLPPLFRQLVETGRELRAIGLLALILLIALAAQLSAGAVMSAGDCDVCYVREAPLLMTLAVENE